jgi:hypothetical protein
MNAAADNREPILIRAAIGADRPALLRLAALDCAPALEGPALVAEVSGDICVAIEVRSRRMIADPFRRTREVSALLAVRAAQLDHASVTSEDHARGRHDSPDRGENARRIRGEGHRAGRGAQPALAPSQSSA